jgi:alkanesulfonate monooxygenase SsuD/methylene tetrahydromethanopterin reductase-like flavin-dependent oxidoreductase (luciferase family)
MLKEAVEIVKSMWTEPETKYDGKYYQVAGAQCDPKPLQSPHPPIWIGGSGEQLTLRVVARHADRSNFGGSPEEFAHKCEVLKKHCAEVGRDYDEIKKTMCADVLVVEEEAELEGRTSPWGQPVSEWRKNHFVGTAEQVAEKIQGYIDLGCTGFIPWNADYPDHRTLRLFAERVMPNFR